MLRVIFCDRLFDDFPLLVRKDKFSCLMTEKKFKQPLFAMQLTIPQAIEI
jgi:hypothetical protein